MINNYIELLKIPIIRSKKKKVLLRFLQLSNLKDFPKMQPCSLEAKYKTLSLKFSYTVIEVLIPEIPFNSVFKSYFLTLQSCRIFAILRKNLDKLTIHFFLYRIL